MPEGFAVQLQLLDGCLRGFYGGTARLTLCVSSGISLGRMPSLIALISSAIAALPQCAPAEALFSRYRDDFHFEQAIRNTGAECPEHLTLQEFRALPDSSKLVACKPMSPTYGDIFQELIPIFGDKRGLLAALDFQRFQQGTPDAAHYYLAYLFIEEKVQRVVSLNWDCLIEKAVRLVGRNTHLRVIHDEPSWLQRNEGPVGVLVKLHGCATQYPGHCENIVMTAADVETVTAEPWVQEMVRDFLNGLVIYCGYRARDSSVNVAVRSIEAMRRRAELPPADYYVAQEAGVEARAYDVLIHNDASRHIRLDANDLFCSIYFGWLRSRLREVVRSAQSRTRIERPFNWSDADWEAAVTRIDRLVEVELTGMLDHVIGEPDARNWGSESFNLPLNLSVVRTLFLDGKVEARDSYKNLRFGEITQDVVLLIVLSSLLDIVSRAEHLHLNLVRSYCGVTLQDSRTGAVRQIIFYRGPFFRTASGVLMAYLDEIDAEVEGGIAPEIVVIPCERYDVGDIADGLAPGPVTEKQFEGCQKAIKVFIEPDRILHTQNLESLRVALENSLELA
jgi:hypothetical protein